ncbi:Cna B-type domain-containing protein, partial [Streptococcus ruminantium]
MTNQPVASKIVTAVFFFWKDKDNQDGLRPTSITVNLLA